LYSTSALGTCFVSRLQLSADTTTCDVVGLVVVVVLVVVVIVVPAWAKPAARAVPRSTRRWAKGAKRMANSCI
jgi:uncharacterized protein HemY